jgi:hypothetical protein
MPQPLLRSIPEAARVAQLIAEVRAEFGAIERNLTEIKDAATASGHQGQGQGQGSSPAASQGRLIPALRRAEQGLGEQGLEGAPA